MRISAKKTSRKPSHTLAKLTHPSQIKWQTKQKGLISMSDAISYTLKTSATQILGSLAHCLRKAETHAKGAGIEELNYLNARLYPDMFEMKRQVYIATDIVRRGAHRLTGSEPQAVEDDEETFSALAARCDTALADVMQQDDAALNAGPDSEITMEIPSGELKMSKREFLQTFVLSNLFFHATTAYALLRSQGVPLGKMDFLAAGQSPV